MSVSDEPAQTCTDRSAVPATGMNTVITGGAGSIGLETARCFLAAGARVVLADIDATALAGAVAALRAPAGSLASVVCDITDADQCAHMIERAEAFFAAPLDVFLAHAGRPFAAPLRDASAAEIRGVIDVNVTGTILSAQAALRSLVRGRNPSLIFTGSLQSVAGRANRSVYTASKHAIAGLAKALALEMGPHGVRVNAIAPTAVDTPFLHQAYAQAGLATEPMLDAAAKSLPLGRIPTAADVAQAALFLASPAAGAITGHVLMIDCGASAGKF